MLRRFLLVFAFLAMNLSPGSARAAPIPFTAEAFQAAQAAGSQILVYVAASWCPTCSLQQAALEKTLTDLETSGEVGPLKVFIVDFDTQKDVVGSLDVAVQSTMIMYHGTAEIGRTIGKTDAASIKAFLLESAAAETASRAAAQRWLSLAGYALSVLAGILSNLSPCVLPLLPVIVASAAAARGRGVLALAAGVALAYAVSGTLVAGFGAGIGLGGDSLRLVSAALMGLFGLLLLSTQLEDVLALAGSPLQSWAGRFIDQMPTGDARGQFIVGLLLGMIWTPCVGPTLAAAVTLAAQREALVQVALMMLFFGFGAALPLVLVGALSQAALHRWETRLGRAARLGQIILGLTMIALAAAVLSGIDREAETLLVRLWPAWLTRIAIRF